MKKNGAGACSETSPRFKGLTLPFRQTVADIKLKACTVKYSTFKRVRWACETTITEVKVVTDVVKRGERERE
ncbi:hypothetical protein SCA6_011677 [Theobroma cacao]